MATTPYSALITAARYHLNAAKGSASTSAYTKDEFWSDDELLSLALRGTTDLWAALIDLHQEHFLTVNEDDVSLVAGDSQLTGVPLDTFRVYLIEPLSTSTVQCDFVPRDYNHLDTINARASATSTAPSESLTIYYSLSGVGAPNSAPIVRTAPILSTTVPLSFSYVPVLSTQNYAVTSANPIPGESDHAIISWIVAYARAKEKEDRAPDASWLAVYATEKQSLLTRMAPRQEQEATYADGVFDAYWS